MKLLPRSVTVFGLLVALSAVMLDSTVNTALVSLIGQNAAAKVAALGALLAALGRALVPTATELDGREPSP